MSSDNTGFHIASFNFLSHGELKIFYLHLMNKFLRVLKHAQKSTLNLKANYSITNRVLTATLAFNLVNCQL